MLSKEFLAVLSTVLVSIINFEQIQSINVFVDFEHTFSNEALKTWEMWAPHIRSFFK